MLNPIDNYFQERSEPAKSCLDFLRNFILDKNKNITEVWRYSMPFYCYNGKRFCYLWFHKKLKVPYIGIVGGKNVHHPELISEKRSKMKILLIDPEKNIPVKKINLILNKAISLHK